MSDTQNTRPGPSFGRKPAEPETNKQGNPQELMAAVMASLEQLKEQNTALASEVERLKGGNTANPFKGLAEEIAKSTSSFEGKKVYATNIDPSDTLEVPVVFSCHGTGMAIMDDIRHGEYVMNPTNDLIKFRFNTGYKKVVNGIEYYQCFSSASIRSKKLVKWLREHSRFNIDFFESSNLAMMATDESVDVAREVSNRVSQMSVEDLVATAKKYGVVGETDQFKLKNLVTIKLMQERFTKIFEEKNELMVKKKAEALLMSENI